MLRFARNDRRLRVILRKSEYVFVEIRHRRLWRHRLHRPARRRISRRAYKGDASLKWAMAGRSKDKLASVRDAIGAPADTPLIVADASDPASLKAMVEQTKSVISTVGPYQFYGNELLAACVASGTDYFDLCGEPLWMRQMIDKHEAAAKASGARIVFSCGFELGAVRARRLLCAGGSQAGVRRAGFARQGPRARHARHPVRRHRRERQGDLRGGCQGSQPRCDPQGSVRADARVQGTETAAGQQAGATRKTCSPGPRRS